MWMYMRSQPLLVLDWQLLTASGAGEFHLAPLVQTALVKNVLLGARQIIIYLFARFDILQTNGALPIAFDHILRKRVDCLLVQTALAFTLCAETHIEYHQDADDWRYCY